MTDFPTPKYRLGPDPKRLLGSNLHPHYLFLDAAAIHSFRLAFPYAPSERQAALMSCLAPASGNRPIIFVTTPLELMIADFIKEMKGKGTYEMRMTELARVGWGQLVIRSHGSLRSDWYLIQPFLVENLHDGPFKMAGDFLDIKVATALVDASIPSDSSVSLARMALRMDAFRRCSMLLKRIRPHCTLSFALMGYRMCLRPVLDLIQHDLGGLGDLHHGEVDLLSLIEGMVSSTNAIPPYSAPISHMPHGQVTFEYPDPDLARPTMSLRSVPQQSQPKKLDALPNTDIYLAFDTNIHSKMPNALRELVYCLGEGISLVSLPAVASELGRGGGGRNRATKLRSLIVGGGKRVVSIEPNELAFPLVPYMDVDGTISRRPVRGDVLIRSQFAKAVQQVIDYNCRRSNDQRRTIFLFGTLDVGCQFLCNAISPGIERVLVPKLYEEDAEELVKVVTNILLTYLV